MLARAHARGRNDGHTFSVRLIDAETSITRCGTGFPCRSWYRSSGAMFALSRPLTHRRGTQRLDAGWSIARCDGCSSLSSIGSNVAVDRRCDNGSKQTSGKRKVRHVTFRFASGGGEQPGWVAPATLHCLFSQALHAARRAVRQRVREPVSTLVRSVPKVIFCGCVARRFETFP